VSSPGSPTPILDRLAPLPSPAPPGSRLAAAGGWLILIAALAAALALALAQPAALEPLRRSLLASFPGAFAARPAGVGLLAQGLAALLALPAAIAIHEVGHVLGGLAAGFRFVSLRIGPLQVDRPFLVSLQGRSRSGYSGWASMVPVRRDGLSLRAAVFVLGGPAANVVSGTAALLLPSANGLFALAFASFSLALAVKELMPIRHRIAVSDGRRLWLTWRDRQWAKRWMALLRLGAELDAGAPPESLSADDLARAVAHRDASPDTVTAHGLAFAAAFHQRRDREAGLLLETCLEYSSWAAPATREALMSDAAVFQARRRGRADLAEQWLAGLPRDGRSRWLRSRAEAAILEARGDFSGALLKLDEVEEHGRGVADRAQRRRLLRMLARWRSELQAADPGGRLEVT
jgi:hypothetical protein